MKFGFGHKLIYIIKKVMGLVNLVNKKTETPVDPNKLTASEIQVILQALKTATVRGEYVELFYSAALKLQNQYLETKEEK